MISEEQEPQPTTTAIPSAAPTADDIAAQIQRTHAEVVAAITTHYKAVEDAMRIAEDAVTIAVHGATKAMAMAQQATKKPDA